MGRKKLKLDINVVRSLYIDQKFGSPYIAVELGCATNTIYRLLKKHGIPIRPQRKAASLLHRHPIISQSQQGSRKRLFSDATKKEIAQEYQKYGINGATLGEKYGCSRGAILNVIKRQGVAKKTRKNLLGDKFVGEKNPNYGNRGVIAGANNVRWIPDRTKLKDKLHEALRASYKYKQWRGEVFSRDKYTCVVCCQKGGCLEAHHIIKMSTLIHKNNVHTYDRAMDCDVLWNVGNGVTLCRECHDKTKWKESLFENIFREVINS